jgi:hypothetical protein
MGMPGGKRCPLHLMCVRATLAPRCRDFTISQICEMIGTPSSDDTDDVSRPLLPEATPDRLSDIATMNSPRELFPQAKRIPPSRLRVPRSKAMHETKRRRKLSPKASIEVETGYLGLTALVSIVMPGSMTSVPLSI